MCELHLVATFGGGWSFIVKEAGKQTLKYGGRKALGCITGVVCGSFGSASIILITKSAKIVKCAKICHSACSSGLNVAELCASTPINILEIGIFGRPVVIESEGFDLFSKNPDSLDDVEKLFKSLIKSLKRHSIRLLTDFNRFLLNLSSALKSNIFGLS